ncbi:MAG: DNA polymerase III subunit delta [Bacteroidota bacterium]
MRFTAIPAQQSIKQQLLHVAQGNQVPHAQLFWGSEGSAQLPLALAFATYLNCQHRLHDDACGQCSSCRKMHKLIHPDVKFVFPTSAAKHITGKDVVSNSFLAPWRSFVHAYPYGSVSDWSYYVGSEHKQLAIPREEARHITQHVSFKALEGAYKVVLVWLPEYLHPTAANALLKVLEEPPPYTIFLLASIVPERIMGTIRSRTQAIYVPAFTDESIAHLLTQQHTLAPEQVAQVVTLADGNVSKALKLALDTQGGDLKQFATWMRACYAQDLERLVAQAEVFQQLPRAGQKNFLVYALHMLREVLIIHVGQTTLARTTKAEQALNQKLGQTLTYPQLKCYATWLNQACNHLTRNANAKLLFLDLSLRISRAFTTTT